MKKLTTLIPVLALLLFLCACSDQAEGTPSESTSQTPAASQAVSDGPVQDTEPVGTPSAAPTEKAETPQPGVEPSAAASEKPAVTSTPTPEPTRAPSAAELKAVAESLIKHPVSELYDAIGQPISSDYAPGCVEPNSEDGELHYDGFVVYTVRTATQEYVYDVL